MESCDGCFAAEPQRTCRCNEAADFNGDFHKWRIPPHGKSTKIMGNPWFYNGWFLENPYKWMIWEYPYFRKPPNLLGDPPNPSSSFFGGQFTQFSLLLKWPWLKNWVLFTPQTLDGEYYYNGQNLGCCLKF